MFAAGQTFHPWLNPVQAKCQSRNCPSSLGLWDISANYYLAHIVLTKTPIIHSDHALWIDKSTRRGGAAHLHLSPGSTLLSCSYRNFPWLSPPPSGCWHMFQLAPH